MSRHSGLNRGPTDYEATHAPRGSQFLLSERAGTDHVSGAKSTPVPQRFASLAAELHRLRAASCECPDTVHENVTVRLDRARGQSPRNTPPSRRRISEVRP
jgi:hypothetical protein